MEQQLAKALILIGLAIAAVGAVFYFGKGFGFFGKLPGDIRVEGKNFGFYFPIATCLLISLLLSAIFWLFSKFR
jgi:hypothetical protein